MLGKWFEDGEELSIGEWQKVALARAFVRDADVLVFDEPTSALDPVSEWKHLRAHPRAGQGRAVVLISHRFSTVRNADRIHILDEGRIVESGTHDELIALDGEYARMYEVQARAYLDEGVRGGGGGAEPPPAAAPAASHWLSALCRSRACSSSMMRMSSRARRSPYSCSISA